MGRPHAHEALTDGAAKGHPAKSGAGGRKSSPSSLIADYAAACQFLGSLVDYERLVNLPESQEDLRLDRMRRLLDLLGDPAAGQRFIQVAGSKGKGSTCAVLSSVLGEMGFRVGMFTSPHLVTVRERIRFGGEPLAEHEFLHLVRKLANAVARLEDNGEAAPTFFEAILAMALLYFREQKADISILEVGLGGRLDATSVISPLVAVITNVSLDHTAILGDTLGQIAAEKAGIIKEEAVVVSSAQQPEVREVLLHTARRQRAILFLGNEDFFFRGREISPTSTRFDYFGLSHTWEGLQVSLAGSHQAENASTALAVLECLDELWGFPIEEEALRRGLNNVSWPGRFEVISWQPLVVLDGAHSPHSAQALKAALSAVFPGRKAVLVFGAGQDKEYREMAEILWPAAEAVIVTQSSHPRAVAPSRLAEQCRDLAENPSVFDDYRKAFQEALALVEEDGFVCVTGSLFLVGDIKAELEGLRAAQEGEEASLPSEQGPLPLFASSTVP